MNFIDRITGIFVKPDKTMEDIVNKPLIEEALVIVGIYAILVMLNSYILTSHITYIYNIGGASQSRLNSVSAVTTIVQLLSSLILVLLLWPIVTVILHVLALFFGGKGKLYPQMLTAIGYTDIVKIITYLISIILFTQLPYATITISNTNVLSILSSVTSNAVYQSGFYKAGIIITLLGVILSSILGVFAVKNGEKLSLMTAAIVVGIPLAIYVIIQLVQMAVI